MRTVVAYPWQDKSGTLSPVRTGALVMSVLPAAWLLWRALNRGLGPRPLNAAILESGDWALYMLLLTLLVTPLRRMLHWPRLIAARQVFGLAASAYAVLHVCLHIAEQKYNIINILSEIVYRFYLGIGMIALIFLLILAATSGEKKVRALGPEDWNKIHKLIYLIVPIGILHFFLKAKVEISLPILLTGCYLWLIGWRILHSRHADSPAGLIGLSLTTAGLTLLTEIIWLNLKAGIPARDVLDQSFDFDYEIKSFWIVLAAGLTLCAAHYISRRLRTARTAALHLGA